MVYDTVWKEEPYCADTAMHLPTLLVLCRITPTALESIIVECSLMAISPSPRWCLFSLLKKDLKPRSSLAAESAAP